MIGICGDLEVVDDSNAGKLEVAAFLFATQVLWSFGTSSGGSAHGVFRFHLRLNIFALPTACHGSSVTHILTMFRCS